MILHLYAKPGKRAEFPNSLVRTLQRRWAVGPLWTPKILCTPGNCLLTVLYLWNHGEYKSESLSQGAMMIESGEMLSGMGIAGLEKSRTCAYLTSHFTPVSSTIHPLVSQIQLKTDHKIPQKSNNNGIIILKYVSPRERLT